MNGSWALITGGSNGIGYELAQVCAKNGHNMVLVARDGIKLDEVKERLKLEHNVEIHVSARDLSLESEIDELMRELSIHAIDFDLLINSAGFATYGPFPSNRLNDELNMMDLNMRALTHLTYLMLDGMLDRGRGAILNVGSTASFMPGPQMAVYYATKAYVLSLSDALSKELEGTGVSVTTLCPGPTSTAFQDRADMHESRLLKVFKPMSASHVAEAGYKGLKQGKRIVIPGIMNKLSVWSVRFTPRALMLSVMRAIQKRGD